MKNMIYGIYPSIVGLMLGLFQTGLFFQLAFTLSSSFRTYLMVTVCWLIGSAIGVQLARHIVLLAAPLIVAGLIMVVPEPAALESSGEQVGTGYGITP